MKNNFKKVFFVEKLTLFSWFVSIFPYIVSIRLKGEHYGKTVYFIDGSRSARGIAFVFLWLLKMRIEQLQFRLVDIKDEEGKLIRLRISFQDLGGIQNKIINDVAFKEMIEDIQGSDKIKIFLKKQIVCDRNDELLGSNMLYRALLLVQIAAWKLKNVQDKNIKAVFFMKRRLWREHIDKYAKQYGAKIVWMKAFGVNYKILAVRLFGKDKIRYIQCMYEYLLKEGFVSFFKYTLFGNCGLFSRMWMKKDLPKNILPRLMVEYYGHLNLSKPELNSDLFFWQQSEFLGNDIIIAFHLPGDPCDERKRDEINTYGMSAVALDPRAVKNSSAPIFFFWPHVSKGSLPMVKPGTRYMTYEQKWMREQILIYYREYDYWVNLFAIKNIKVYISWLKYDAHHCVIADAMEHTGGVTVIYQRSFEEFHSPETVISSDIVFGFSPWNADIECKAGSIIPYHVSVGYYGDHRSHLLKPHAEKIRNNLKNNGARYILAFFDENSLNDSRWHTGHEFMRENYVFLLEKVLKEPRLGIVFKPKTPSTLRKRLGGLAELLKRAEETGRCIIIEEGSLLGAYPPMLAALVSDVTIHGHLCAATAGLESALAGVPTLLLDREGWPISNLYKLNKGSVVFTSWQDLWKACQENWNSPAGIPGFGDWSSMIDTIDPFRDGRSAERIGTYLKWLLDGFKAGLPREMVLADAAERYGNIWGKDKVTSVNSELCRDELSLRRLKPAATNYCILQKDLRR